MPAIVPKQVIYDFGSNNGDDLPYYLKKADVVVAVEANPALCREIAGRFAAAIQHGRLFVENCVLTTDDSKKEVFFYIHKTNHVLSQFPEPASAVIENFDKILLPSQSVLDIVERYGEPHYIKIDIERYDEAILRTLFRNGIRPPFISAESHSISIFALFVSLGGYDAFKLVDGHSVETKYKNHPILLKDNKRERYSFPHHSAGPFGDDIDGNWMTANNFFRLLAFENLGWKDIHATNQIKADPSVGPSFQAYALKAVKHKLRSNIKALTPGPLRYTIDKLLP